MAQERRVQGASARRSYLHQYGARSVTLMPMGGALADSEEDDGRSRQCWRYPERLDLATSKLLSIRPLPRQRPNLITPRERT